MAVTDKTDDAAVLLASKLNTLHSAIELLEGQVAAMEAKLVFPIWAEENGQIANNQREFSYGNGAVGSIGIPAMAPCECFRLSFNADSFNGGASMRLQKNNADVATVNWTVNNQVIDLPTPVSYTVNSGVGDLIGMKTGILTGGASDVRVIMWMRLV